MSKLQQSDLLPIGTRVRINKNTGFAANATGIIINHIMRGSEVHTLCYNVEFDVPQPGMDDEFGVNYTPEGGFKTGPFKFNEVRAETP